MERRTLTELAFLSILADEPADLDAVRDRLTHVYGRHWPVSYGALEPAVSRLVEAGSLVRLDDGTYSPTESGRERLRDLASEPVEDVADPSQQPHLLVKVGSLHHLPPERRDEELAGLEDRLLQARDHYQDVQEAHAEAIDDPVGYRRDLGALTARLLDEQLEWVRGLRD
jgi:DNA-binding PadR family transcriptional regulator